MDTLAPTCSKFARAFYKLTLARQGQPFKKFTAIVGELRHGGTLQVLGSN